MTRKYTKKSSGSTASTTNSTAEIVDLTTSTSSVGKKRKSPDEKAQPITKKALNSLTPVQSMFEKYKGKNIIKAIHYTYLYTYIFNVHLDDDETIGPEGIARFCSDIGLAPDSFEILVLAWTMNASKMGYFSKNEFSSGFEKLQCSDLSTLKKQLNSTSQKLKHDSTKFTDLYKYAFGFASEVESKKSVDLGTAAEMLKLLLPEGPHTTNFAAFLCTQPNKSINKDQWLCFLEFSRTVKADLSNYDDSEAWPLLLDQFSEWVQQEKRI
ncbi:hypothetical protein DDB_G0272016 [Dictyostelium discoideum AX4]|uniref:DCN1-like protein 2 n=1 Tax=Dictyostelium discoideum TaxID=44689 RepID=DCN1M_DICDI|nr:hypothetical protein DDB_G0272016 [Dictyostelium discoideum AX4]Q86JM4.1 RecName: Full=DCN1-like protein 2; AltName: Full=Defective in cullin neddylation protein 1-like protein 2 [Dictyostelium discoideum]EAL71442.1 hypothetical protein DDB_G0272016 [Dictyostelium discoideum AX4]|eukprot:XP_645382.1 hypothetical protein DDB_G0272016 [Dictyostelium discoideum AX4]